MLTIDGAQGEGGGQILRSSLALSLITGQPFRIERIRAGRKRPGLLRQHLTAARAAAEVSGGRLEGDRLGASTLSFTPAAVRAGEHRFAIGSAGSASLVLQTVLPALLRADGPSRLRLEGGTHNPFAPPFEFLERSFLPLLGRMGVRVSARLERPGFYPAGGGVFEVEIEPAPLARLELLERGALRGRRARALVARLPRTIAERELARVRARLGWEEACLLVEERADAGPGTVLTLEVEHAEVCEVVTGFGERGVPAERVADGAISALERYLTAGVPVGEHLADQLLLPLAVGGGGVFRTLAPSPHARTNLEVIRRFLPLEARLEERGPDDWLVALEPG